MNNLLLGLLMLLAFSSCSNKAKTTSVAYVDVSVVENDPHPGKQLMETYCYVCHSPTASEDDRLGPPMIAVKKHYITEDTTQEEFEAALQNWIKNPNEEDAKMFGAVRRFGVMTKTPFPEDAITQIADYIFNNDIEQPEWFEEHFKQGQGKGKVKGKGKGKGMGKGKAKN